MNRVTIRVPATTANLGPGFDAFGCALSLYTDVTFQETEEVGLEITGCDEEFTGPDNMAYASYCAVLASLNEPVKGVKIHIDAHIPVCRGLGSSAALLVAGAMGANVLRGNRLSTQGLLNITNAMEGHPDNLAPAFYGGLTASMVDNGLPVTVNFPLHPGWEFLALIPDFNLPTSLARSVLPEQVSRADAIYNISHGAMVLKALELGDEKLLRNGMQDRLHQKYRRKLIPDYDKIEALVRTTGAALKSLGLNIADCDGILVTHEHSDHVKGLSTFLKKNPLPVYGGADTLDFLDANGIVPPTCELNTLSSREEDIGAFGVQAFPTSHDVPCVGYRIHTPDGKTMTIATDLGVLTPPVHEALSGCDLVALESNYDLHMLRSGPYPYYLRARIESARGHLSNDECSAKLLELVQEGCKKFALCHLSQENNTPMLALQTVFNTLGAAGVVPEKDCVVQAQRRNEVSPVLEF